MKAGYLVVWGALWLSVPLAYAQGPAAANEPATVRQVYALGPDDQVTIRVEDMEGLTDKPMRIDSDGYISLPLLGRVRAAGMTTRQLEEDLAVQLQQYIKKPQVSVSTSEVRSQPVTVIGAVATPGVYQLQGHKTLAEVLSMAGGLKADAGYSVRITRAIEWGRIPLPKAGTDPTGQYSVAEVRIAGIMDASSPQENILMMPDDLVSVPKADMVYVIGDVTKAGGIVLSEQKSVSVLQALSAAGGLLKTAKPKGAKILRVAAGVPKRQEVPVNLKDILNGKKDDIQMQAEDILFVPDSSGRTAILRLTEVVVGGGLTSIIWRATQ